MQERPNCNQELNGLNELEAQASRSDDKPEWEDILRWTVLLVPNSIIGFFPFL